MKDHNKEIRSLTESANRLYEQERINEALGAGDNFGQQQPNIQPPPKQPTRPKWSYTPTGPANQTAGLYGRGGFTYYDGLPVTEEWQNQWDKWINSGADSGVPAPWPPQFQGMFENDNVFDFDPSDPQSGWYYYNSIFNWLFGGGLYNWGNGGLQQLINAGIIDIPPIHHEIASLIHGVMSGGGHYNPYMGVMFIQLMFGDTGTTQWQNIRAIFSSWIGLPVGNCLMWLWSQLFGISGQLDGQLGINNPMGGGGGDGK